MLQVLVTSKLRSPKLRWEVRSTVLIISGSDGLDSIAILHIAKSEFSLHCVLCIMKSRSPIIQYRLWSTIQITSYPTAVIPSQNRISQFRVSRCQEILTFQSVDSRSPILHAEIQRSRSLLARRLRLHRKIAYRDFEVSVSVCSWHIKVPIVDAFADITRGLTRVRSWHVSLWFMNCMCLKC